MPTTQDYPYEYFAGANVFVLVNGEPILEVAGISYNEMDSQQPIYGYSSRLFDTVAPGQKIIQGKLVVNLVSPNYLHTAVNFNGAATTTARVASTNNTAPPTKDWRSPNGFINPAYANQQSEQLKRQLWDNQDTSVTGEAGVTLKDITTMGPVSLRIEFANKFAIVLDSCFFIGRSSVIQIDEHVILEEYSFFARNSYTQKLVAG